MNKFVLHAGFTSWVRIQRAPVSHCRGISDEALFTESEGVVVRVP